MAEKMEDTGVPQRIQKVLIADDSRPTLQLFKKYFKKALERKDLECEILEATNGKEAIKLIDVTQPDLVLCDINMPEKNGFEVYEAYKNRAPDDPFCVFAFISSSPEERKKAFKTGAIGFVSKQDIDYFVFTLQIKCWLRLAFLERERTEYL